MAHGHPDYGQQAPVSTIYKLEDLGELAARLGSLVTHDRRGDVIGFDSFEAGSSGWTEYLDALGSTLEISTLYNRTGIASLKASHVKDANAYAGVKRYFSLPVLSKVGVEFAFAVPGIGTSIHLYSHYYDAGIAYQPEIRYRAETNYWAILDATNTCTDLFEQECLKQADGFNVCKLVFDMTTNKYERLIVNDQEHDLTAYGIYGATGPSYDCLLFTLWAGCGPTLASGVAYFDDFIITHNEP